MKLLSTVAVAALLVSFGAYAQDSGVKPCVPGQQASRATGNGSSQLASQAGDRKDGSAQLANKAGGNEPAQLASQAGDRKDGAQLASQASGEGAAPQLAGATVCE